MKLTPTFKIEKVIYFKNFNLQIITTYDPLAGINPRRKI